MCAAAARRAASPAVNQAVHAPLDGDGLSIDQFGHAHELEALRGQVAEFHAEHIIVMSRLLSLRSHEQFLYCSQSGDIDQIRILKYGGRIPIRIDRNHAISRSFCAKFETLIVTNGTDKKTSKAATKLNDSFQLSSPLPAPKVCLGLAF